MTPPPVNLKAFDKDGLVEWIRGRGERPYRARQLWTWMYRKDAVEFGAMTDLSKSFRVGLSKEAFVGALRPAAVSVSSEAGARKYLWECPDGARVESVFIPEGERRTVCVSSQVGCALGCAFCATGSMGGIRDLEAWEIVDQVLGVRRDIGVQPSNIVVMGMGEPFLNYEKVMAAMAVLNDPEGLAIGHRRITISTAGIVPGIARFTAEKRPYKLAISLNATTDAVRSRIMPVGRKYPLEGVMAAARAYTKATRGRITFEYVLFQGVNDSRDDAKRLISLLKALPCKVNLIPYNPGTGAFERPEDGRVAEFLEWIKPLASPVIVRWSRGVDIDAACGQLAVRSRAG
jgi:23S rRNA (adenine2503-C2)-methyltransferase